MGKLKISADKLMLVAGGLWSIAGISILQIGLSACFSEDFAWWTLPTAATIFSTFYFMIFRKMVARNEQRILSFNDAKTSVLNFLDKRGYVIMVAMMTLGIVLRSSGLVPDVFFAFFYTGLGSALLLTGLNSASRYIRRKKAALSAGNVVTQ